MYRTMSKLAAVALVFGVGAADAGGPLITLSSTGAETTLGDFAEATVLLTVNAPFSLLTLDALLGYGKSDLELQLDKPVYGSLSAQQIVDSAPTGWMYNLGDSFGASLSVVIDPFAMPAGLPVPAQGPETLHLRFKGLATGTHSVTLDLGVLDDVTLAGGSMDPLHYATEFTIQVNAVPEPATYALMLGGLAAVGALVRGRRAG